MGLLSILNVPTSVELLKIQISNLEKICANTLCALCSTDKLHVGLQNTILTLL